MATTMTSPLNPINASTSHAVSRTSELLSCARTALKIGRAQNPPPTPQDWWFVEPSQLELYQQGGGVHYPQISILSEDGLALLRAMQVSLETLQALVKRRGHVNDPTHEIASCTRQLETDAKELTTVVEQLKSFRSTTAQHQKHLALIAAWLQSLASQQTAKLKEILKVRGTVLADQAQRRKLWNPQAGKTGAVAAKKTIQESPLFTMTPSKPKPKPNGATRQRVAPAHSAGTNASTNGGATTAVYGASNGGAAAYGGNTGYGGSAAPAYGAAAAGYGGGGGGGYGGYYGGAANTGMRQRRNNPAQEQTAMVQEQVQMRQEKRQTQNRLETAKQAETSLAELSTLFGKMSNLIVAQGETLEKIEDDVEAAHMDVASGQAEIQILYGLKKGNRSLILKTFAVLIFVILFMRLY